ncbi:hypothetical protein [Thermoflexibacter ruber]|uniref:Uncharacterized protein n=1 Tax=Thermoflexibacter ruber TaxID=1003 RepID=A0A1I2JPW1_9BACT|nr:hypothetical protein [Thermoflexibacter ruber]SFF56852.1 hypothetical protein SAMN04488541_106015 [Thermoflexibacter ruber]
MKQLYNGLGIVSSLIALALGYLQLKIFLNHEELSDDEIFYLRFIKISGYPILLCFFIWTSWIYIKRKYFTKSSPQE